MFTKLQVNATSAMSAAACCQIIGRSFLQNEQITDHPNVVLLSYDIWQRSFAGDREVLGKTVHIGSTPSTVIGVMPKQFRYPLGDTRAEVWVPIDASVPELYLCMPRIARDNPLYLAIIS